MDTQKIKSLAELKADARAKRQEQEQQSAAFEQAQQQRNAGAWRAFLISIETELHPELYAALDRERPNDFTLRTDWQVVTIHLHGHSRIQAAFRFVREPEPGWEQCKFAHSSWARWMVEERYYYMDDQYNTTWREYSDLGEALLAAENEGNEIAKRERAEREREQAEINRKYADLPPVDELLTAAPAPEPTPAEVLVDAVDGFIRDYLSRNGYSPVDPQDGL